MLYEIGGSFNPQDPEVIQGLYETREQRRKVGYVNIPADRGGETKYGIAQNANPEIVVRDLDLNGAMQVYYTRYWLNGSCDRLPYPLTIIHFDGCVNHGVKRANRFLQQALGVSDDGQIGNGTLGALSQTPIDVVIASIADRRRAFYQSIVKRDPSQGMFLKGWMRRIDEVYAYTSRQLS
jgi:lysozyme family protein